MFESCLRNYQERFGVLFLLFKRRPAQGEAGLLMFYR